MAALVSVVVGAATSPAPAPRPNILWISVEDMSPDLGCYGDSYSVSPNVDRLARQGIRLTQAFAHTPVCAPSRSTIITGRYATSIGSHQMRCQTVPQDGVRCFTEYLRAAGYYCTNNVRPTTNSRRRSRPGMSRALAPTGEGDGAASLSSRCSTSP